MKDPRGRSHRDRDGQDAQPVDGAVAPANRIGVEELFRGHAAFVAAFLGRLGVPAGDVDDLVQEVFLVVHRKGGFELGQAQPRSWLGAIAVRVASTRRRSVARRREQLGDELYVGMASHAAGPEDRMGTQQALARVQKALDALDDDHRGVFVLYELEGEACTAIAAAFDLPIGTVYSRLHHARKRFMESHAALVAFDEEATTMALPQRRAEGL